MAQKEYPSSSTSYKDICWLTILVFLAIAIASLSNLMFINWDYDFFPYVLPGTIAHYYINYIEFGFVKRGLVASILRATGEYPSVRTVHWVGYTLSMIACGAGAYMLYRLKRYFNDTTFLFFAGFVVFNSATFANLGFDIGRLDHLLLICSFLSLYYIRKDRILPLIVISMVALLIHEIYLIMFFPIITYALICRSEFSILKISYLGLGMGLVLAALFFLGKIEGLGFQEIANRYNIEGYNFGDYGIIWTRNLTSNVYYTFDFVSESHYNRVYSWIIGGCYTFIAYVIIISISLYNNLDWRGYPIVVMSSAVIFFMAIDYSRWFELMIINALIFFGYTVFEEKGGANKVEMLTLHYILIGLFVIISLTLGPIGYGRSFPLFEFF